MITGMKSEELGMDRTRRAKEEQMPDNVEITIFSKYSLFSA